MKMTFAKTITIAKIDDDERMVFGFASTPDMDSDGEVITAEAMEKAMPAYLKFPTLREMHQPKAVGTIKESKVDKKGLYIGAKVVTDEAWKLVKEGVYKAFSIGGNVLERVGNVIHGIELIEISLVDSPANKSAVIELWKKDKMDKNAESVYSLSNLMIQIKDMIYWYEYSGKDTKKLSKILEEVKALIVDAASEPEPTKEKALMLSEDPEDIKKVISVLEQMDFADNKLAEVLRKGTLNSMKDKLAKKAPVTPVVETPVVETPVVETPAAPAEPVVETPVVETETPVVETPVVETPVVEPVTPAVETPVVETPVVETPKSDDPTMTKLSEIAELLKGIVPVEKEVIVEKSESFAKTVESIVKTIGDVAKTMKSIDERLKIVESAPAAVKSKSVIVHKTIAGTDAEVKTEDAPKEGNEEVLKVKKARLVELNKFYDEKGASAFAKAGYSKEAMELRDSIALLEKSK